MRWLDPEKQTLNYDFPIQNDGCSRQFRDEDPDIASESRPQNPDQPPRQLCESMKVILLALLDRIDALENEMQEDQVDTLDLRDEVHQFEGSLIRAALASTKGRQRRAARVLGMKVSTLNAKIRRHQVAGAGPHDEQRPGRIAR